jgi:radical SAM protein with 4Fe4S-binding SPASM domain
VSGRRLELVSDNWFPAYVVWELTLRCDHACHHCGSRAGVARDDELGEAEALRVVEDLARLGAREVVLIGGEAYLHDAFFAVIRALKAAGLSPQLTTGGRGVGVELATRMKDAGLDAASVSVDGLEPNHDRMRNAPGSYRAAMQALRALRDAGIRIGSNINLNRLNQGDLEELYELLRAIGISAWQVQLTAPLGRAADRTDLVLQPWQLLDLLPRIARLKERAFADGIRVMPGNNLGYFGPEEALLRSFDEGGRDHYAGCQAGKHVMGIESHGDVKGCPSLQSAHYVGGNLRSRSLASAWNASRDLVKRDVWGFCATCAFAEACQGGCTFTAHALLGRPGNNPYCHFRARELRKRGLRERLVPARAASGKPFDNGAFDLIEEAFDAPEPALPPADALVKITQKPAITSA